MNILNGLYWMRRRDLDAPVANLGSDALDLDRICRNESHPDQPLEFEIDCQPGSITSAVWTDSLCGLLIDNDLLAGLDALTGWRRRDAVLRVGQNSVSLAYTLLAIEGRCGPVDPALSELVFQAGEDRPVVKGLYFDASTWDGSDLCVLREPCFFLFVSQQAKEIFERLAPDAVGFVALSDIEQDPLGMASILENQIAAGFKPQSWLPGRKYC